MNLGIYNAVAVELTSTEIQIINDLDNVAVYEMYRDCSNFSHYECSVADLCKELVDNYELEGDAGTFFSDLSNLVVEKYTHILWT